MEGLKDLIAGQQRTSQQSVATQIKEWALSLSTSPAGRRIVGFQPASNGAKVCAIAVEGMSKALLVRAGAVDKVIDGENVAQNVWVTSDGYLAPSGEQVTPQFS